MNKNDLINAVAEHAQITKANAAQAVQAVFDSITESLKKEEPVTLAGFGSFKATRRAARQGRNPRLSPSPLQPSCPLALARG